MTAQATSECIEQWAQASIVAKEDSGVSRFAFCERPPTEIVAVACRMPGSDIDQMSHGELHLSILFKTGILQQIAISYFCVDDDCSWGFRCNNIISHNSGIRCDEIASARTPPSVILYLFDLLVSASKVSSQA